ncbi:MULTISPECIES: acyltransferase family protein [unclassified Methanoregula]|uniref:acyltransferase family protein n=1 Tax=unclassified Methanoregula TaxID=2649730 RepID=UPI0009C50FBE|nr:MULTISPECIES: acyltransferase family protein [unclassified Methanoregula]OPX63755.1 MAG: glucans biosynthesis protein [Methanoregula sp. PtaB.Bin085]OPY35108.1 MAG: glucans biosynthesis protein [Methanoregula sp. PtaU1.Bin006]
MIRLHYIDNLRWISILLLFPFHTAFIFCAGWYGYYVQSDQPFVAAHLLTVTIEPWIMPLLFCIAGMSMRFALQKRNPAEYLRERVMRLLVPFIAGVVLVCPVIAFYALKFHTGYTGSFAGAFVHFFSSARPDRSPYGMTGDFSVDHLWFIISLFLFSVIALGVILAWRGPGGRLLSPGSTGLPALILLFVPVWLLNYTGTSVTGYSLPAYFALFLIGYSLLSSDGVQELLEKKWAGLLAAWVLLTAGVMWTYGILLGHGEVFWGSSAFFVITGWTGVLAFMGAGRHYLDTGTPLTARMHAASYPVYILHQALLVAVAYYLLMTGIPPALQYAAIVLFSIVLTFACYEVIKRIPGMRVLFGIAGIQEKKP